MILTKAYLGGTEIKKAYLGSTIVLDNTSIVQELSAALELRSTNFENETCTKAILIELENI